MSRFLRLLNERDKERALKSSCKNVRSGNHDDSLFELCHEELRNIPGSAFAYWISKGLRTLFLVSPTFGGDAGDVKQGVGTSDDFRFARLYWEVDERNYFSKWFTFAKGGGFARFYSDLPLVVNWEHSGKEIRAFSRAFVRNDKFYFHPGLTWSDRTTKAFSARVWPAGGVFSVKGSAGFFGEKNWTTLGLMNSSAFQFLISLLVGAGDAAARSYQVGVISSVPYPEIALRSDTMADKAYRSWSLRRTLDSTVETSHAFLLPPLLRERLEDYNYSAINKEIEHLKAKIDQIAFDYYRFFEEDRKAAQFGCEIESPTDTDGDGEDEDCVHEAPPFDALLSWTIGVAFGRFDWRLATGERTPPPEPDPFDPLPARSPGMLPDGAAPLHKHPGMLVDDSGHDHDLPRLMEAVLDQVDAPVDRDIRRWLRKDFFKYHLQQYSKSRRKAPIYWPLATTSGDYTVWVYYPMLTGQTLFTAVNDFVEPKLQQVADDIAALRHAGSNRSRQEEQRLATLVDFEAELAELRDTLLAIAPGYKPDQDDGVQITAAPLWRLFRHTPWRKVLQETWERLERGDYDWAKIAMAYWPQRVREKCVADQSLAIAHDLEHLYEPPATGTGKKNKKS